MVRPSLLFLFGVALTVLSLVGCQGYVIVTSPSSQSSNQEISLKVFFSTKTVSQTHTVTSTITQSVFPTCYATEPGIVPCQRKRDFGDSNEQQEDETHEPKVVLNGQEAAWETFITPSRVARQVDEEFVEEVYPSENVQVVQPDQGEPAAVVYAAEVVPEPKIAIVETPAEIEEIPEVDNEIEPVEERHHEEEVEEVVDNADDHVDDEMDTLEVESTEQPEVTTTEMPLDEMTMTTLPPFDYYDADPARENETGPELETSQNPEWEQKDVVIMNKPTSDHCMEMKNDLFINVMSTLLTTRTLFETKTVTQFNTALFKSEGGCLPSDVNQVFSSSCI